MDMENIENKNSEISSAESIKKKWLIPLLNHMKRLQDEQTPVRFWINAIRSKGFLVRIGKLFASVPFEYMPWKYETRSLWQIVAQSLVGKSFLGTIDFVEESTAIVHIKSDNLQLQYPEFPAEQDKTYTAIVLRKSSTMLLLDLGYAFGWQYGSFLFKIDCLDSGIEADMFSHYNLGAEINVVYVGKSASGNDVFRFDEDCYFSKEYSWIGQKMWEEEVLQQKMENAERIKIEIPIFKPKIVGKIDIDAINAKTKPKRRSKEELKKLNDDRMKAESDLRKARKDARKKVSKEKEIEKTEDIHEQLIDIQEDIQTQKNLKFDGREENTLSVEKTERKEDKETEQTDKNKSDVGTKINKIIRAFSENRKK